MVEAIRINHLGAFIAVVPDMTWAKHVVDVFTEYLKYDPTGFTYQPVSVPAEVLHNEP